MFDRFRSDWEPAKHPVDGPPFRSWLVNTIAIHYTADNRIPADVPQYLANIQTAYLSRRGYSIGYNVAIDQHGICWELRGTTYKCAANKGYNDMTFAVLMLVDGQNEANPAMIARIRQLVGDVRRICPDSKIVGHRDIGSTACPGVGLYSQLVSGVFEPQESPSMIVINYLPGTENWVACVYTGTHLAWVRNGYAAEVLNRSGVQKQTVNRAEFAGLIQSAKTTTPAPPMDAELVKLWKRAS